MSASERCVLVRRGALSSSCAALGNVSLMPSRLLYHLIQHSKMESLATLEANQALCAMNESFLQGGSPPSSVLDRLRGPRAHFLLDHCRVHIPNSFCAFRVNGFETCASLRYHQFKPSLNRYVTFGRVKMTVAPDVSSCHGWPLLRPMLIFFLRVGRAQKSLLRLSCASYCANSALPLASAQS